MPASQLTPYVSELGRRRADRELAQVRAATAGSGAMKEADRRDYLRKLQRDAGYTGRAPKATSADLAAMGIEIIEE